MRALLPQLRISARRAHGVLRDAAGKFVVAAELHEGVHVVDRPDIACPAATVEIHEIPGYAKQTDRTLDVLRAAGVEECETDTLTLCAAAAGVELSGFTATATVPLEPEMAAADGFRLVLANLATTITANWQRTIDQTDPEFLHHLRIAVRRSRVVLANAKQVLPPDILAQTRNELSWLAALTSTPRDLDVYLLECFGSLLPKNTRKQYVKRLKALQDNLGEHQDAEVHVHMLRAVATELHESGASPDTMVAIGQLTERLDQQRLAARVEFAERFADYDNPATQRALDAMLDGIAE